MIYIVIHHTTSGFMFSGAYSNRQAAQECADEADFYQGVVYEIDMNEVQDTYTGGAGIDLYPHQLNQGDQNA